MRKIIAVNKAIRERTKFLWFPKVINGEQRWFEKTTWIEKCSVYCGTWFWTTIRWKDRKDKYD